jgi:hypothetical protein
MAVLLLNLVLSLRLETSGGHTVLLDRSLAWGLPCLTLRASGQLMVMLPALVA